MTNREATIRSMLPIVKKIATRLKRLVPNFDFDDLTGDGCVGLIRAVDSYDPSRGPTLQAYVRKSVLGAMLNGIRRMDPVSERARRMIRDGENRRYTVAAVRGAVPTPVEMERCCPGYVRALAAVHWGQPLSLDAPLPEQQRFVPDGGSDPARIVEQCSERAALAALIAALPARQRAVLVAHYYGGNSLRSIGRKLAISPQRASQLHTAAIARLKRHVHAAR